MGDGGILSNLGYRNMWPRLKDMPPEPNQPMPSKQLQFCCEKRVPSGKVWVGMYCSMAMAAHALDLVAEALSWADTPLHYGKSDLLIRKAGELRADLGPNYNLDDKVSRKKVTDHASNYANLFSCSDSKQALITCFQLWVALKGTGPVCIIRIERPCLPPRDRDKPGDREPEDQFYAPTLLLPTAVPVSLRPKDPVPLANSDPICSSSKTRQCPSHVLGTRDLQNYMGVEPDLTSHAIINEGGEMQGNRVMPCIYQQWTWCTRTPDETHLRRWRPSRHPDPPPPTSSFHEIPEFIGNPRRLLRFSLLNYLVYERVKVESIKSIMARKRRAPSSAAEGPKRPEWRGTNIYEHKNSPSQVEDST